MLLRPAVDAITIIVQRCSGCLGAPLKRTSMTAALALFTGGWLFASVAAAQNNGEVARCRAMTDATARLRCYDALVPTNISTTGSIGKYASISLTDLKLDRASM